MSTKFSQDVIKLSLETQEKYGVPASVTLAQYALESGYGTSGLSATANNYFGISGDNNGKYVMRNGRKWRKYSSMSESFDDHGRLLSSGRYAEATAGATTSGEYVDAIAEIYAPSSDGNNDYAGKLKTIINENNLTQYDKTGTSQGGFYTKDGTFIPYVTGVSTPSTSLDGAANPEDITQTGWKDKALDLLAIVIKVLAYVILVVLAFIFFTSAFNIPTSKEALLKQGISKVAEEVI